MAERRSLTPNHLSGSPPVSRPFPVLIPPPRCAMSAAAPAAMAEELEAARQKRMKMHREQEEAAAASSESPRPPATPDSKSEPPAPVAPETLTSPPPAAAAGKERKRKEVAAASALVKAAVRKEEKMKRKRSKHKEAAPTPSPSAASKILEVAEEGAMARKERRRVKAEQGQSDQPPVPDDVHPQVGEAAADDGVSGSQSVQSSTDQDPKYSSPFDFHAFLDQFRYKPERRQGRNAPSLLKTPPRYRLVKEAVQNEEEMKRKQSKHAEAAAIPSPSAAAQILEVPAEGTMARKERMRDKVLQGQSDQSPVPDDVHPQIGEAAADDGVSGSQSVSRSGKPLVRTGSEILNMRIETLKQQQMPQGFIPTMANLSSTDQDPKHSSPFDFHAFFDQFRYKPEPRQGRNAPSLLKTPSRYRLVEEAVWNEEKMKRKRSKHEEAAPTPSPSASSKILEVAAEGDMERKERRRVKAEQGQSGQPPVPDDVHPQIGEAAAHGGVSGSQIAQRSRSGKPLVRTDSEILKMRIETLKQQQMPRFIPTMANLSSTDQDPKYSSPFDFHAFFDQFRYKPERRQGHNAPSVPKMPYRPARPPTRDCPPSLSDQLAANGTFMAAKTTISDTEQPHSASASGSQEEVKVKGKKGSEKKMDGMRIEVLKQQQKPQGFIPPMANFNSIEQDPKYSSPFGAFFDQFSYKPERQQGHNAPSVPKMPYRAARPSTQDRPPSLSDQLTANETFMAAKTTISDTEQPHSVSASGSQEEVKVKGKKGSGKKMDGMKKPRKPVLTAAEKRSDMYRRLPLNELVIMPCSPHELLQERYADDPWKVIVICMLLNLTQGKQVREKVEGFFERYPDAQTAYTADPEMMAEYLRPLGLQNVKTNRIQKFSKAYVGEEWEYITELCGVGKYAADAYAIFCAGRPADVVPEDHKLVDYWKFVCP